MRSRMLTVRTKSISRSGSLRWLADDTPRCSASKVRAMRRARRWQFGTRQRRRSAKRSSASDVRFESRGCLFATENDDAPVRARNDYARVSKNLDRRRVLTSSHGLCYYEQHEAGRCSYVGLSGGWGEDPPVSERDEALSEACRTGQRQMGDSVGHVRRRCPFLGKRPTGA